MLQKLSRAWSAFWRAPDVLKIAVALVLLVLAGVAMAGDRIARQGADEVRISDSPCVHAGTLIQIDKLVPEGREGFQRAEGLFGGQRFFACWRPLGGDLVHLIYEDGDQGIIPLSELKDAISA